MKNKLFIIGLIVIIFNVIFLNVNKVKAEGIHDIISGGDSFISEGSKNIQIDQDKLKETSNSIYNILLALGTVIAVIIASVLGIKFMLGSIEEKAQIKESLIPFIIGCVVIFGAFGIWKITIELMENIDNASYADSNPDANGNSTVRGNQAAERWIEKNLTGEKDDDIKKLEKIIKDVTEQYDNAGKSNNSAVGELGAQLEYLKKYKNNAIQLNDNEYEDYYKQVTGK